MVNCGFAGMLTSGPRGMLPKYLFTIAKVSATSKSPPMVKVALFGPYQRKKKAFKSLTFTRFKSSI